MAGKYGSASIGFLVDGYNLITAKLKALAYKIEALTEPTTGLGDTWEETAAAGVFKVSLTQDGGFFDTQTNGAHAALSGVASLTPQSTARTVCAWFAGSTVGQAFVGFQGAFTVTYDVLATIGALTKANASYAVTGQCDQGVILQPLAAQTIDWVSTGVDLTTESTQRVIAIVSATKASPCVVTTTGVHGLTTGQLILTSGNTLSGPSINSEQAVTVISTTSFSVAVDTSGSSGAGTGGSFVLASTVNGGAAYLEVTAFSGLTGFVGTVQHSTDNSTWATLATFANITSAPGEERVAVAAGTTVRRYLRLSGDVTGTGSITAFVGFSRAA